MSVTVVDKGTETQTTDITNRCLRRYLVVNPFGTVSLVYKALSEVSSFFKRRVATLCFIEHAILSHLLCVIQLLFGPLSSSSHTSWQSVQDTRMVSAHVATWHLSHTHCRMTQYYFNKCFRESTDRKKRNKKSKRNWNISETFWKEDLDYLRYFTVRTRQDTRNVNCGHRLYGSHSVVFVTR
jgi:hypothetical protein